MRPCWLLAGVLVCGDALSHPLAPALLELRETAPDTYQALWRTSVARAQRADVLPQLPARCTSVQPVTTTIEEQALVQRWSVRCAGGIAGERLAVAGLPRSGINVIVRIEPQGGAEFSALLDARNPELIVPATAAKPSVFGSYGWLGVEHLLLGFDHLLFIAGLVLLLRRLRVLIVTVTAFTLGHSLTLGLATLGLVKVNAAVMELGIALSILLLATELARPAGAAPSLIARRPALMAASFGLLHGLGFASALAEVGLPQAQIPLALLAFNLGIEAGQVAVIVLLLVCGHGLLRAWKALPAPRLKAAGGLPVYLMGSLAAYWCFERASVLFI